MGKRGFPLEDFDFIKIAPFGWFAKSKKTDFIGNIYDVVDPSEYKTLYTNIIDNYPDTLDFNLPRSEWAEKQLFRNICKYLKYQGLWKKSLEEIHKYSARFESKIYRYRDIVKRLGMPGLLENGVGCISADLAKTIQGLDLEKLLRYKKNLLIPTFVTPKHVASLEVASLHALDDRTKIWVNGESGWYGSLEGPVVGKFSDLKAVKGFTWNRKADFWTTQPLEVAPSISTSQLIQIWSDAKRSEFQEDPIELIVKKEGSEEIRHHLGCLTYEQAQELQRRTGEAIVSAWIETRQNQFVVQGKTFNRRGSSYYLVKSEDEEQLTNFTMDIKEIRKRKDGEVSKFFWCGFVNVGDASVPFELEDKYFTSSYLFTRGVRDQFLNLGLGIPFVNQRYVGHIMNLIQLCAHGVEVVPES